MSKKTNGLRLGELILTAANASTATGIVKEDTPTHLVFRHRPRGQRSYMDSIVQRANLLSQTLDTETNETTILHNTNVELLRLAGDVEVRGDGYMVYHTRNGKKRETFVPNHPGLLVNLEPNDDEVPEKKKAAGVKKPGTKTDKPDAAVAAPKKTTAKK